MNVSNLDKESLRRVIIQLRADGYSFQEISDILLEKYGISKSRQSIHGIFNRAMRQSEDLDDLMIKADMLHLYQLGYNKESVIDIIKEAHADTTMTQYRFNTILDNSKDNLTSIENEQLKLIEKGLKQKLDYDSIKIWLSYKGKEITGNRFKELLTKVVTSELELYIKSKATDILELTGDRELAKQIAREFNVELKPRDINRAINNI